MTAEQAKETRVRVGFILVLFWLGSMIMYDDLIMHIAGAIMLFLGVSFIFYDTDKDSPNEIISIECGADIANLKLGLYIIYWKNGGESLASVGQDYAGRKWLAPTDWIYVPVIDWGDVKAVKRIK